MSEININEMSDQELADAHTTQSEQFLAAYNDRANATPAQLIELSELGDKVAAYQAELDARRAREESLAAVAETLQAKAEVTVSVTEDGEEPVVETVTVETESAEDVEDEAPEGFSDEDVSESGELAADELATEELATEENATEELAVDEDAVEELAAEETTEEAPAAELADRKVNLAAIRRQPINTKGNEMGDQPTIKDVLQAAPDVPGYAAGAGMDFSDVAKAVGTRMQGYNRGMYASAAADGRAVRQQNSLLTVRKPNQVVLSSSDPAEVSRALDAATNEKSLPGGSLVASGGWCAPSEVLYDVCELESRDGVFDLPEVTVTRGGLQVATSPSFADLYSQIGFQFTEANDIAGNYGPNGTAGSKPCFKVDCPDFVDYRLDAVGLCLSAGLLQARAYPEYIERIIRGALVAHDHRVGAAKLAKVIAGSTVVDFPETQVGGAAPILGAVEIQVEHLRSLTRISRNATIEAVFPHWAKGAIRADLSRRLGVDLLSVTDAQIDSWFAARGVRAQYVYGLQDLTAVAPAQVVSYPAEIQFLLYPAGTWVAGVSDIITIDSLYDSTLLAENDYTALFTEEGLLVAKRCADSRVVSVGVCADGATAAGVDIACNGTAVPVAP